MKTRELEVNSENIGIVRTGMSGARTELRNENGFNLVFLSYKGEEKFKIPVKAGNRYIVGPDWAKEVVTVGEDKYFPRKWGRLNKVAHTSYFKLLDPSESWKFTDSLRDIRYVETCPEKLVRVHQEPSRAPWSSLRCYINKKWLETATWEEFESAMADPNNRY